MAARSEAANEVDEAEFVISRLFDAPRALVYKAWTDPMHLARWWGPRFFTNRCEVDLRPGGKYRFVMIGPDGTEHPMKGAYVAIVAPERIVYTVDHSENPEAWHDLVNPSRDRAKGRPALESVHTVTFEERDGKTLLTVRARFDSKALRDAFVKIGMRVGWSLSLDKLDELLWGDREITAARTFDAPRELVFEAWTNPEHLPRWWGPRGFTVTVDEIDLRPGGHWRFVMHGPDGTDYKNEIVFVEIVKPERLVLDHVSGPLFRMTVQFTEWAGKTAVAVRMRFESAALRSKIAKDFGAVEGLVQNLEKLEAHLRSMARTSTP
jgi:uncharacterized protein YndB with AHSA1/START domain